MTWQRFVVMLAAAVALSACGNVYSGGADQGAAEGDNAQSVAESAENAEAVVVSQSAFGDILVDGQGRTLYLFDSDTNGTSTCVDDCAETWPPLAGSVTAGDGIDGGQLAVIERADGTTQATFAGRPLYYFEGDQAAGDTNGQGVGDVWWVVAPNGSAITDAAADTSNQGSSAGDSDSSGYSGY